MSYYGFNSIYLNGNNFFRINGIDSEINSIDIGMPKDHVKSPIIYHLHQ